MNSYIFITDEGYTFELRSEVDVPEVENLQVLGIADGDTPEAAFEAIVEEETWIAETTFSECLCLELKDCRHYAGARHFQLPKKVRGIEVRGGLGKGAGG